MIFISLTDPYRIFYWSNLYGLPLISLIFAPFSYYLHVFFLKSTNISMDEEEYIQKEKIYRYYWYSIGETLPFTIFGAIIINVYFFLILYCILVVFSGFLYRQKFLKNSPLVVVSTTRG